MIEKCKLNYTVTVNSYNKVKCRFSVKIRRNNLLQSNPTHTHTNIETGLSRSITLCSHPSRSPILEFQEKKLKVINQCAVASQLSTPIRTPHSHRGFAFDIRLANHPLVLRAFYFIVPHSLLQDPCFLSSNLRDVFKFFYIHIHILYYVYPSEEVEENYGPGLKIFQL